MGLTAFLNVSADIVYSMVLSNSSTGKTFFFPDKLFVGYRAYVFLLRVRPDNNVISNHNLFSPCPKFKDFAFRIFFHYKRNDLRFQTCKRSIFQEFWTYNPIVFFDNVQFTGDKHCSWIHTPRNQQDNLRNSHIDRVRIGNVIIRKRFCYI